jgi:acyl-CoA thioesterase-1
MSKKIAFVGAGTVVVPVDKIDAMEPALDGLNKQEARIISAAHAGRHRRVHQSRVPRLASIDVYLDGEETMLRGFFLAAVRRLALFVALVIALLNLGFGPAHAATIVALGASNTFGKGVARNQAYPSQLEAILRAKGHQVRVINAGVNGETTGQMLSRLDRAVPQGTSIVILQPGGNDERKGVGADRTANIAEIQSRLSARGIKVIISENSMLHALPRQPDGRHLTAEGYRMLAEALAAQVESAIGK